jgi:hypothetical protein
MSFKMIRSIYHAYFQSRLQYGIIFWGPAKDSIMVIWIQKKGDAINSGDEQKNLSWKYISSIQNIDHAFSLYLGHVMFHQTN